jgi:TRAP transporter TAXI family solute receptor
MASTRRTALLGSVASAAILGAALFSTASPAQAQDDRSYILTTATTGGTYYPVGVAIATLVKVKLQNAEGIDMAAISSAGSGENIGLMRDGQAQFAILQGLFGRYAANGSGPLEAEGPQEWLRSIGMLWRNVEHFIVTDEFVDTGTIDDLAALEGQPFSIGARNSGTEGSGREILAGLGIDPESMELVYQGYGPSAEALQNGTIVGVNMPGGVPVTGVTQAFAARDDLTILDFTPEQVERANGGEGELWVPYTIPAGSYPNQDEDAETIAQPNFLGVHMDVDEEAVYLITKTMFENLAFLQNIHPATNEMSLDAALAGLPAPLHPGAARYFEEAGVEIPERLMPN